MKVRFTDNMVPDRLSLMAKTKGYSSREEYVREILTDHVMRDTPSPTEIYQKQIIGRYEELGTVLIETLPILLENSLKGRIIVTGEKEGEDGRY
ncbi:hypothetical protein [Vagococcus fluvialis]|uniref:Uncharacterized protein n=1 Tax=Vagococcus fluvialis TaxID=2738 RepID=A0A7X6I3S2_9ENTE|nr:hypothetical protein [Vagococcus fluvialis]NKC68500.1 hypothetical protein [Vagococcus fluvialis]